MLLLLRINQISFFFVYFLKSAFSLAASSDFIQSGYVSIRIVVNVLKKHVTPNTSQPTPPPLKYQQFPT